MTMVGWDTSNLKVLTASDESGKVCESCCVPSTCTGLDRCIKITFPTTPTECTIEESECGTCEYEERTWPSNFPSGPFYLTVNPNGSAWLDGGNWGLTANCNDDSGVARFAIFMQACIGCSCVDSEKPGAVFQAIASHNVVTDNSIASSEDCCGVGEGVAVICGYGGTVLWELVDESNCV